MNRNNYQFILKKTMNMLLVWLHLILIFTLVMDMVLSRWLVLTHNQKIIYLLRFRKEIYSWLANASRKLFQVASIQLQLWHMSNHLIIWRWVMRVVRWLFGVIGRWRDQCSCLKVEWMGWELWVDQKKAEWGRKRRLNHWISISLEKIWKRWSLCH